MACQPVSWLYPPVTGVSKCERVTGEDYCPCTQIPVWTNTYEHAIMHTDRSTYILIYMLLTHNE